MALGHRVETEPVIFDSSLSSSVGLASSMDAGAISRTGSRFCLASDCQEGEEGPMALDYIDWLGRRVILKIDIGVSQFPLRGQILGESSQAILCRVSEILDVDIPKKVIVHVKPDTGEAYEQIHSRHHGAIRTGSSRR
jgi:hypothetical protein